MKKEAVTPAPSAGGSSDEITVDLCAALRVVAHNVAHGTADPLHAAGVISFAVVHLEDINSQLAALSNAVRKQVAAASRGDEDESETDEPAPAKAKRGRPPSDHRHKFVDGVCTVGDCRKEKGKGGRPPSVPDAEARTVPLPLASAEPEATPATLKLIGDTAADKYADGGQGSSAMVRR